MFTTLLIMLWALISVYAMINVSALVTTGKLRILAKCVKEWKRRGEYEADEEYDMMFFSLPTAILIGVLSMIPVFHLLLAIPFAIERKDLMTKFLHTIEKLPVEWKE